MGYFAMVSYVSLVSSISSHAPLGKGRLLIVPLYVSACNSFGLLWVHEGNNKHLTSYPNWDTFETQKKY